jgi:diacylglycerol kinase (ATP)
MNLPSSRIALIYNPNAGKLQSRAVAADVAAFWRKSGWEVSLQPTAHAGHAVGLARAAADDGYGLVLVMGGDGTISDVANGLVHSETALAMLPTGTANSFAKELGNCCRWSDCGPTARHFDDPDERHRAAHGYDAM